MHFLFSHWSKSSHFWVEEVIYRIGLLHTRCLRRFGPWLINSLKSSWPSWATCVAIGRSESSCVLPSYLCGSDNATASGTLGSPFSPHQKNNVFGTLCQTWRQFCLIIRRMKTFGVKIEGTAGFNMIPNSRSRLWFDRHTRSGTNSNLEKNWSLRKASLSSRVELNDIDFKDSAGRKNESWIFLWMHQQSRAIPGS